MRAILAMFFLLTAGNAIAQCERNIHLADIPYSKNSSYFPRQYSQQLDNLVDDARGASGYLILEFRVQKQQLSEELRNYNIWLANRRIERVKGYLTSADYPAPIVSRLLTASTEESRNVSIIWCDTDANTSQQILAE